MALCRRSFIKLTPFTCIRSRGGSAMKRLCIYVYGCATLTAMATADAGGPSKKLEPPPRSLKSPVWKYFGFAVSYGDNVRIVNK